MIHKKTIVVIVICIIAIILIGVVLISPWLLLGVGLYSLPNPPQPEIQYGEFEFSLTYTYKGEVKEIHDILVCEYDGVGINEGKGKYRQWKENLRNIQSNELFCPSDTSSCSDICIEQIGEYKIILGVLPAEWFLNEPDYAGVDEMPYINIFNSSTGYYIDPDEAEKIYEDTEFKILDWKCDKPIKNTFK